MFPTYDACMLPSILRLEAMSCTLLFLKIPKAATDIFQDIIEKLADSSFFLFYYYFNYEEVIFFPSFSYNATSYSWKKKLEVIALLVCFFIGVI